MRRAKWLALRSQVCQFVEVVQHEVTCRLPKRRDAFDIPHFDNSVLCSEHSPRTVRVGMAAQVIGAFANVRFDEQLHPKMFNALRIHSSKCGVSGLRLVRMTAPKSDNESVLRGVLTLSA